MVGSMGVIEVEGEIMKKVHRQNICPIFSHLCVLNQSLLLNRVSQLRTTWTSHRKSRAGASASRFLRLWRLLPLSASPSASHGSEISTLFRHPVKHCILSEKNTH